MVTPGRPDPAQDGVRLSASSDCGLHVLPAETALDTEIPVGHAVVIGRRDLDDYVVLHVHLEVATDAAIGADRSCDSLFLGLPVGCFA